MFSTAVGGAGQALARCEGRSSCASRPLSSCGNGHASASECGGGNTVVLGVETSCDDTGVAVMKGDGQLLGNCLNSQTAIHKTLVRRAQKN